MKTKKAPGAKRVNKARPATRKATRKASGAEKGLSKASDNSNRAAGQSKRVSKILQRNREREELGYYGNQNTISYDEKLRVLKGFKEYHDEHLEDFNTATITVRRYFILQGYSLRVVHRWIEEHPELEEYFLDAYERIGDKREAGMFMRVLPESAVMPSLHHFLPEYQKVRDDDDERKIKVQKSKDDSAPEPVKIVIAKE